MRFTLRFKLVAIVAVAATALIVLAVTSALSERTVERQVDSIRDTYLPKIRLRPRLQSAFDHLSHALQNAAESSDADQLAPTAGERDGLAKTIADAHDALTAGQATSLRQRARRLLRRRDRDRAPDDRGRRRRGGDRAGPGHAGEEDARRQPDRVSRPRSTSTTLDAAFDAADAEAHGATVVRIAVGGASLLLLLAISLWIGSAFFANLGGLVAGLERFGRNDFATPIASTSRDEIADVAAQANKMAEQLLAFDAERTHVEWLRGGLAELDDALRGDLEPSDVADRAVAYLARYLHAAVGALYHGPDGGPWRLLGRYAMPAGVDAPRVFAAGEGLVGEAATRTDITVLDATDDRGFALRSGLVAVKPRVLVLLPLHRGAGVTGVVELACVQPWRDVDSELLASASRTIAIALDSAHGRAETRHLLEQTRAQAVELARAGATLEQRAAELARASAVQVAVPREHVARAAHAAQRDHRVLRAAARRGRCRWTMPRATSSSATS